MADQCGIINLTPSIDINSRLALWGAKLRRKTFLLVRRGGYGNLETSISPERRFDFLEFPWGGRVHDQS